MAKKKSSYTFSQVEGGSYLIRRQGKRVPPGNVTRILNTKMGNLVKQMVLDAHSIILVQRPRDQQWSEFDEAVNALADDLGVRTGIAQILIGCESINDFKQVTEEQMAEIGWVRAERVLAYIEESFEDINKRLEEEE